MSKMLFFLLLGILKLSHFGVTSTGNIQCKIPLYQLYEINIPLDLLRNKLNLHSSINITRNHFMSPDSYNDCGKYFMDLYKLADEMTSITENVENVINLNDIIEMQDLSAESKMPGFQEKLKDKMEYVNYKLINKYLKLKLFLEEKNRVLNTNISCTEFANNINLSICNVSRTNLEEVLQKMWNNIGKFSKIKSKNYVLKMTYNDDVCHILYDDLKHLTLQLFDYEDLEDVEKVVEIIENPNNQSYLGMEILLSYPEKVSENVLLEQLHRNVELYDKHIDDNYRIISYLIGCQQTNLSNHVFNDQKYLIKGSSFTTSIENYKGHDLKSLKEFLGNLNRKHESFNHTVTFHTAMVRKNEKNPIILILNYLIETDEKIRIEYDDNDLRQKVDIILKIWSNSIRDQRVSEMLYHFAQEQPNYLLYYVPQLIQMTFDKDVKNFDAIDNFLLQHDVFEIELKIAALSTLIDEIDKIKKVCSREKSIIGYRLYEIKKSKLYKTLQNSTKNDIITTIKKLPIGIKYLMFKKKVYLNFFDTDEFLYAKFVIDESNSLCQHLFASANKMRDEHFLFKFIPLMHKNTLTFLIKRYEGESYLQRNSLRMYLEWSSDKDNENNLWKLNFNEKHPDLNIFSIEHYAVENFCIVPRFWTYKFDARCIIANNFNYDDDGLFVVSI